MIAGWLLAVAAAAALSSAFSGAFRADYTARGSDSRAAQDLLAERFPALSGETVDLVVRSRTGPVTAPEVRGEVERLLAGTGAVPHVKSTASPYETAGAVSGDGATARATVQLDVATPADMPHADTERIIALAEDAARPRGRGRRPGRAAGPAGRDRLRGHRARRGGGHRCPACGPATPARPGRGSGGAGWCSAGPGPGWSPPAAARRARAAVPRRPVRLPGRRQRPGGHGQPAGVRHARRGLRPGRERPAAARRDRRLA